MAGVHSALLGKFLEYSFDGLMADVVTVDWEQVTRKHMEALGKRFGVSPVLFF